ncbi:ANTAR domain-containing response regulator [Niveibacterium terrae]|uniref:ANTAR domain-containing response regulator n=1 Tax=Niveibacterium terrae TaxID=3373598 RepID=UPI003A914822
MASPPKLRVLLVNDTGRTVQALQCSLIQAGYEVLAEVNGAAALLYAVENLRPDVIIIDTESPSLDTLEQLSVMGKAAPHPVIMFAEQGELPAIRAAVDAGVTAYVVDTVTPEKLAPIINLAQVRFEDDMRLKARLASAEQQLADRKAIDKAKLILMQKRALSEERAYALLRSQAMEQGLRLADIARQLINTAKLLG